jgi:hypothetical protein
VSRPTLLAAVEWIAINDNAQKDSHDNPNARKNVERYSTVALVADLFDVSRATVARRVMELRYVTPRAVQPSKKG